MELTTKDRACEINIGDRVYLKRDSVGYTNYKLDYGTVHSTTGYNTEYNSVALIWLVYRTDIELPSVKLNQFYVNTGDLTTYAHKETYSVWN